MQQRNRAIQVLDRELASQAEEIANGSLQITGGRNIIGRDAVLQRLRGMTRVLQEELEVAVEAGIRHARMRDNLADKTQSGLRKMEEVKGIEGLLEVLAPDFLIVDSVPNTERITQMAPEGVLIVVFVRAPHHYHSDTCRPLRRQGSTSRAMERTERSRRGSAFVRGNRELSDNRQLPESSPPWHLKVVQD